MSINKINIHERNLLGLAVKCRLISTNEEKEIWSVYIQGQDKNPDTTLLQIFRDKGFLSEEEINFLLNVKKHLKTKTLDKRFGELGVANRFVKPEKVEAAFNLQNEIFHKTRKSKLIGDILVEQNEISKANKTAILLTQDRVEDEYLAETLDEIATTEMEKINMNMRFGAIAVKKEFITLEQLNQGLGIQKVEEKKGSGKPYLGKILKEEFGLTDNNIATILKIQKELEKQRLSLEKALLLYHQGTHIQKQLGKAFEYRFSKNKLEAYIQVKNKISDDVEVSDFISWLNSIGITYGICSDNTIRNFLDTAQVKSEIKVAQGRLQEDPVDESIEFCFNTDVKIGSEPKRVKKGDVLAKIIPHQPGKPGKNVCGFNITPSEHKSIPLFCGEGVIKKENQFVCETDGMPTLFKSRTLLVVPDNTSFQSEYYDGHITEDFGEKYQSVNLEVGGGILPGGRLVCNELIVKGDVRGLIQASGSVHIEGSVMNPSNDPAKSPCIISSGDDITIDQKILNMIIITSKSLKAPHSDLMYSKVYAFDEIMLNNVFSNEGQVSHLQIGKNPHLKEKAIDQSITEKNRQMEFLSCKEDLDEIEAWFDEKVEIQNNYLRQHTILQELIKIYDDMKYDRFETLEEKIVELVDQTAANGEHRLQDLLVYAGIEPFIKELINDTNSLSKEVQKERLQELKDTKFGMYRASVNATRRYKNEYKAKRDFILKKVEKALPQINELEKTIQTLSVKMDYLKYTASKQMVPVNPAIRVKNMVEKRTVIKGRHSSLIIDQNIYGVKITEKQDKAGRYQIVIEGFYD